MKERKYVQATDRVRRAIGLVSARTSIFRKDVLDRMLEDRSIYDQLVAAAKEVSNANGQEQESAG